MGSKPHTIETFIPTADIGPFLIVASTTADKIKAATAATDKLLGTTDNLGAKAGEPCGIALGGVCEVALGGTVANGDFLTSDGNSKAIVATAAADTNKRVFGVALQQGEAGDIIKYRPVVAVIALPGSA